MQQFPAASPFQTVLDSCCFSEVFPIAAMNIYRTITVVVGLKFYGIPE
jgi:hypothetical protein